MVNVNFDDVAIKALIDSLLEGWEGNKPDFPWTTFDTTKMVYQGRSKTSWLTLAKEQADCKLPICKLAFIPNNPHTLKQVLADAELKQCPTQKDRLVKFRDKLNNYYASKIRDAYGLKDKTAIYTQMFDYICQSHLTDTGPGGGLSLEAIALIAGVVEVAKTYAIPYNIILSKWVSMWENVRPFDKNVSELFMTTFDAFVEYVKREISAYTKVAIVKVVHKPTVTSLAIPEEPKPVPPKEERRPITLAGPAVLLGFEVEYPLANASDSMRLSFKELSVKADRPTDPVVVVYTQHRAFMAVNTFHLDRPWAELIAKHTPINPIGWTIVNPNDDTQWLKMDKGLVIAQTNLLHVISNTGNLNRLISI